MENKTYNAAVFVIPNGAGYCNEFLLDSFKERYKRYCTDLCAQKGIKFDPEKDQLVQVWFASEYDENLDNASLKDNNLGSDNLEAHGFLINDNHYRFRYGYLPYPLIKDVKEGDTMDLEFEINKEYVKEGKKRRYLETDEESERIKLHLIFDQRSYRYRNFGNFEEVVKYVLR